MIIAGAGSGKTTVMAARVVWLIATGRVAARRDPRPDLHHQGHRRARDRASATPRARPPHRPRSPAPGRRGAGGGRRAHRRRPTTPTPPTSSPSTGSASGTSPMPGSSPTRSATSSRDGPSQRSRAPCRPPHRLPAPRDRRPAGTRRRAQRAPRRRRTCCAPTTPPTAWLRAGDGGGVAQDLPRAQPEGDRRHRPTSRAARPHRRLPRPQVRAGAGGLLRPDRARRPSGAGSPRGRRGRARQVQGRAARRVPGHLGGPGDHAEPPLLRAPTPSTAAVTR